MTELPSGWTRPPLGQIARITAKLVDPAEYAHMPHIAPNHIEGGTGRLLPYRSISEDGVTSPKYRFSAGEVLYSKIRPYLAKTTLIRFDGLCSADMYPLRTDADPAYLAYWMISPMFTALAAGHQGRSVLPKINREALFRIPIPLPPFPEQRRIVEAIEEHFSRLDAAEESIRRSKRNLGRFRAAALADSFAGDYKSRPLGEVARTQLGKMLSKKAHWGGPGGRPYLRNKNVQWGRFDLNDVATMEFNETEAEKFRLQEGDVLVCEGGEVGRAAIWRSELGDCYFQKALHRVRPSAELSPDFLVYYLRRLADTNGFDPYVTGSTIDHLPQEDLRVIPVPVPSREQQRHVVALVEQRLSVAEAIEAELDVSLQRSAGLRQAILKEAFGGRLVPQNPSTNPGSDFHQKVEA